MAVTIRPSTQSVRMRTVDALSLGTMNYRDSEELAKKTCIAPVPPPTAGRRRWRGLLRFARGERDGIAGCFRSMMAA
ncbi:hypothetical protein ACFPU0_20860 [Pseudomonas sp. GCM10022186]|uniref:hypothetical protein n=1 Tax=Pseudomonas sp. GCM10022186 TaxID=3252650 RepID=UPI003614CD00